MVRFFGKPRKTTERATPTSRTTKAAPPPSVNGDSADKPAPKPRRRTTAGRPPRRDWAAEAAATPAAAPAPKPASLATAPIADENGVQPAKRRRGTRGGRGRKKTTANGTQEPAQTAAPAATAARTPIRDRRRSTTLDGVAETSAPSPDGIADISATLRGLEASIAGLREEMAKRPPSAATAHPRVGIFVDVPNVIYAAERRGITIDFGRVLDYFTRDRELVRATAYAPISDDPQAKLESQRFAHHFIGHPYRLVTKPLKRFADGSMKANFDIELAVDILTMSDRLDVVVLMSGDGDFRRVVELVASRGVRVEVVAFSETASAELKSVADRYIDIGAHLEDFKVQT